MPVKRVLQIGHADQPPSKTPVFVRSQPHLTGIKSSQEGKAKVDAPPTELEKLDSLRSKLEQSLDAFIRARKELEEISSAEGSNKQEHVQCSADLKAELKRHRELTSKVATSLTGNAKQNGKQGAMRKGSSYEVLKSIMN